MKILLLKVDGEQIRINLYQEAAPVTCEAFCNALPLEVDILHARVSGEEVWTPEGPALNIIQENATVHPEPGEIVIAPVLPVRNKVAKCIGIFYGEGKLVDCANVFGKVHPDDADKLKSIGKKIWLEGSRMIRFEVAE